jgi:predicted AAA+ superfamily ATPase
MRVPYIIGPPVYGPDFYGRRKLLDELMDERLQCICLIGNRRTGKTSLLRYLESQVPNTLFLDMQGLESNNSANGAYLSEVMHRSSNEIIKQIVDKLKPSDDFCDILQKLTDFANDNRTKILLLIDEAEKLRHFEKGVLQRLLMILRNRGHLRTIIAGSKGISILNDLCRNWQTTPFLSVFSIKYISPLSTEEAKGLICQSNSQTGEIEVNRKLRSEIARLTGNHPYLIQVLCARLFKATGRLRKLKPQHDLVVDEQLSTFFQNDYNMLSHTERRILHTIASKKTVQENVLMDALKIEVNTLRQYMMGLKYLGYIVRERDLYRVSNEFLNTWLVMNRFEETSETISDKASLELFNQQQHSRLDEGLTPIAADESLLRLAKAVCLVSVPKIVNGRQQQTVTGTAWLITPNLALTCAHVIEARSPWDAPIAADDLERQTGNLLLRFDHRRPAEGVEYSLARLEWRNEKLDCALLRLTDRPDSPLARRGRFELDADAPLTQQSRLLILQHPDGQIQQRTSGDYSGPAATPGRILYTPTTAAGSSGAPVLNMINWRVIALHTGQSRTDPSLREGVLLKTILADLKNASPDLYQEIVNYRHHEE